MNEADYHPDDWNALMQLVEYANVLVAQETADPADVGFYVKSIDILLASMRMADEEELDYTYEINPIREDDYICLLYTSRRYPARPGRLSSRKSRACWASPAVRTDTR